MKTSEIQKFKLIQFLRELFDDADLKNIHLVLLEKQGAATLDELQEVDTSGLKAMHKKRIESSLQKIKKNRKLCFACNSVIKFGVFFGSKRAKGKGKKRKKRPHPTTPPPPAVCDCCIRAICKTCARHDGSSRNLIVCHPCEREFLMHLAIEKMKDDEKRSVSTKTSSSSSIASSPKTSSSSSSNVSSPLNQQICSFVPSCLLEHLERKGVPSSSPALLTLDDSCLAFVDVSGYTKAASDLGSRLGASSGADATNEQLQTYFNTLIDSVEGSGGSVSAIAGDALIVAFPRVEDAAVACWKLQRQHGSFCFSSETELTLHIGIGSCVAPESRLIACVVGNELRQFFITGPVLHQLEGAVSAAASGEIVCSREAAQRLASGGKVTLNERLQIVGVDEEAIRPSSLTRASIRQKQWSAELVRFIESFIVEDVLKSMKGGVASSALGELKRCSIMFIDLRGASLNFDRSSESLFALNEVFNAARALASSSSGFIRQLVQDDKGCTFIIGFTGRNAPLNAARSALTLLLELRLNGFGQSRIGLSTGDVFYGAIGSKSRREVGLVGPAVNLSARLCFLPRTGSLSTIICDHDTAHSGMKTSWGATSSSSPAAAAAAEISFVECGSGIKLKGFEKPISVFSPVAQMLDQTTAMSESPSPRLRQQSRLARRESTTLGSQLETLSLRDSSTSVTSSGSTVSSSISSSTLVGQQALLKQLISVANGSQSSARLVSAPDHFGKSTLLSAVENAVIGNALTLRLALEDADSCNQFSIFTDVIDELFFATGDVQKTCDRLKSLVPERISHFLGILNELCCAKFDPLMMTVDSKTWKHREVICDVLLSIFVAWHKENEGKRLVLLIDNYQNADQSSQQLIRLLIERFSHSGAGCPRPRPNLETLELETDNDGMVPSDLATPLVIIATYRPSRPLHALDLSYFDEEESEFGGDDDDDPTRIELRRHSSRRNKAFFSRRSALAGVESQLRQPAMSPLSRRRAKHLPRSTAEADPEVEYIRTTTDRLADANWFEEQAWLLHMLPYSKEEIVEIVARAFGSAEGKETFVDDLANFLYSRSDGQPILAIEWHRHLLSSGVVKMHNEKWVIRQSLSLQNRPPTSLSQLVLSWTESIPVGANVVLKIASCFGRAHFDEKSIAKAAPPEFATSLSSSTFIEQVLSKFARAGWMASSAEGGLISSGVYSFSSCSIRDSIYASLPAALKRKIHQLIARLIRRQIRKIDNGALERELETGQAENNDSMNSIIESLKRNFNEKDGTFPTEAVPTRKSEDPSRQLSESESSSSESEEESGSNRRMALPASLKKERKERLKSKRSSNLYSLLAHHLVLSVDALNPDPRLIVQALQLIRKSGSRSLSQWLPAESCQVLQKGLELLELLPDGSSLRYKEEALVLDTLSHVYGYSFGWSSARSIEFFKHCVSRVKEEGKWEENFDFKLGLQGSMCGSSRVELKLDYSSALYDHLGHSQSVIKRSASISSILWCLMMVGNTKRGFQVIDEHWEWWISCLNDGTIKKIVEKTPNDFSKIMALTQVPFFAWFLCFFSLDAKVAYFEELLTEEIPKSVPMFKMIGGMLPSLKMQFKTMLGAYMNEEARFWQQAMSLNAPRGETLFSLYIWSLAMQQNDTEKIKKAIDMIRNCVDFSLNVEGEANHVNNGVFNCLFELSFVKLHDLNGAKAALEWCSEHVSMSGYHMVEWQMAHCRNLLAIAEHEIALDPSAISNDQLFQLRLSHEELSSMAKLDNDFVIDQLRKMNGDVNDLEELGCVLCALPIYAQRLRLLCRSALPEHAELKLALAKKHLEMMERVQRELELAKDTPVVEALLQLSKSTVDFNVVG